MLNYPISVFIDTNIFISAKYDISEGSVLRLLEKYSRDNKVTLYTSNIVINEIEQHIRSDISAIYNNYKSAERDARKLASLSLLGATGLRQCFELPRKEEIVESAITSFMKFISELAVTILNNDGVEVNGIVNDYFLHRPPFENNEKKKHEFPDAIMISKLKKEFSAENPAYIITGDKGFKKAFNETDGFVCFDSLSVMYDQINNQEALYEDIRRYFLTEIVQESITQKVKASIIYSSIEINGMDCDRKGYCEGFEYIETSVIDVSDISLEFGAVIDINEAYVLILVMCRAEITAICTYEDYDNAIWDSEEGEYIFLEEVTTEEIHQVEFECTIKYSTKSLQEKQEIDIQDVIYDIELDQETRISRKFAQKNDNEVDAIDDMMDTLEDYYKH